MCDGALGMTPRAGSIRERFADALCTRIAKHCFFPGFRVPDRVKFADRSASRNRFANRFPDPFWVVGRVADILASLCPSGGSFWYMCPTSNIQIPVGPQK